MDILSFVAGSEAFESLRFDWLYDDTVDIKDAVHYLRTMGAAGAEQFFQEINTIQTAAHVDQGNNHYMVMKNGVVVYDETVPADVPADALYPQWSVTKILVTFLVLKLMKEHGIGLNDPVKDHHLPELSQEFVGSSTTEITFKHLLDMKSGLAYPSMGMGYPSAGYPVPESNPVDQPTEVLNEMVLEYYAGSGGPEPGQTYIYHNDLEILGIFVYRASGQDLVDYAYEQVFSKLGVVRDDFYFNNSLPQEAVDRLVASTGSGYSFWHDTASDLARPAVGGQGVVCTTEAMLKYTSVLANRGEFPDSTDRIVDEDTWNLFLENGGFWFSNAPNLVPAFDAEEGYFRWTGYEDGAANIHYSKNVCTVHNARNGQQAVSDQIQSLTAVGAFFDSYLYETA